MRGVRRVVQLVDETRHKSSEHVAKILRIALELELQCLVMRAFNDQRDLSRIAGLVTRKQSLDARGEDIDNEGEGDVGDE